MSTIPKPINEPILNYSPGSPERISLQAKLKELSAKEIEIPLIIGGAEVRTGHTGTCVMPHNHGHVLARFHQAGSAEVAQAIDAAKAAWAENTAR
jgi:1-pyrroline-5-carboxylate dehydrogenase